VRHVLFLVDPDHPPGLQLVHVLPRRVDRANQFPGDLRHRPPQAFASAHVVDPLQKMPLGQREAAVPFELASQQHPPLGVAPFGGGERQFSILVPSRH